MNSTKYINMTLQEAIIARHSVRQYIEKPIEAEKIEELKALIEECNHEGGTHLQLVTDEPKVGYYGEKVVIRAQMLGLNTCWVGLSFSKQPDSYQVLAGEKLFCVISLGYGANQGVQHKNKPLENFAEANGPMPEWFRQGVEAAILAPLLSTSRNLCLSYTTATAWRPRRSSPSSAMPNSTSASPSTTSRWEPGKRTLNGRKSSVSAYRVDRLQIELPARNNFQFLEYPDYVCGVSPRHAPHD